MTTAELAIASMVDLPGGKRIWFPPNGGRPFWAHLSRAVDLTDEEIEQYVTGKETP